MDPKLEALFSMFLLAFGLTSLFTGAFTTYFGAGKSRKIGALILAIGVVATLLVAMLIISDSDDTYGMYIHGPRFWVVFAGVLGGCLAMGGSLLVVLGVMKFIKEPEEEIDMSEIEKEIADIEKELEVTDSDIKDEKEGEKEVAAEEGTATDDGIQETDAANETPDEEKKEEA